MACLVDGGDEGEGPGLSQNAASLKTRGEEERCGVEFERLEMIDDFIRLY